MDAADWSWGANDAAYSAMCGQDERANWRLVAAAADKVAAKGQCKCGCKAGRSRLDKCLEPCSNNMTYLDEIGWHFYLPAFITAALDKSPAQSDTRPKSRLRVLAQVMSDLNNNIAYFWERFHRQPTACFGINLSSNPQAAAAAEDFAAAEISLPISMWPKLTADQGRALTEYFKLCYVVSVLSTNETDTEHAALLKPLGYQCLGMQKGSRHGNTLSSAIPCQVPLKTGLSGDSLLFAVERRLREPRLKFGELLRYCTALSMMRLGQTATGAISHQLLDEAKWRQRRLLWIGQVADLSVLDRLDDCRCPICYKIGEKPFVLAGSVKLLTFAAVCIADSQDRSA